MARTGEVIPFPKSHHRPPRLELPADERDFLATYRRLSDRDRAVFLGLTQIHAALNKIVAALTEGGAS
ncbi:MAG: hypothetical protein VB101_04190 [Rhodospirillaceae bacterium]|nr:hypothetical protein [Rhodospirillaceae bacterium]